MHILCNTWSWVFCHVQLKSSLHDIPVDLEFSCKNDNYYIVDYMFIDLSLLCPINVALKTTLKSQSFISKGLFLCS